MTEDYNPDSLDAGTMVSQVLSVATICPSPTNPRKTFDPERHAEMIDSVKRLGVLQAIVVRPWPADYLYTTPNMPLYELVAGERRWRAARDAGLTIIPGTVRQLNNEEVLEIQVVENLHRDDLDAIEEAVGFATLMSTCGMSAEALAEKIGKSKGYIYGRLKLAELTEPVRDYFRAGDIDKSIALMIARIPPNLQAEAAEEVAPLDAREAGEWIRKHYMLDLRKAPFPPETLALTKGDCSACPKRTSNQPDLYRDVRSADLCTDPICYKAKREYNLDVMRVDAQRAGRVVATLEEAKRILPYGHVRCAGAGYTVLDQQYYRFGANGAYQTVREHVGDDHPDIVMVPHDDTGQLVAVIKESIVERIVKAKIEQANNDAATKPTSPEQSAQATREKAAKTEAAYRKALFEAIDRAMAETKSPLDESVILKNRRLIARQFWLRLGNDAQIRLARHLFADGNLPDDQARIAAIDVDAMTTTHLTQFMVLCALIGMVDVPWYGNFDTPSQLLDCARRYGVDPDAIKSSLEDAKKPKSGKKSTKKTALHPEEAALALEDKTAAPADAARADEAETPPAGDVEQAAAAAKKTKGKASKSGRASPSRGVKKPVGADEAVGVSESSAGAMDVLTEGTA